MVIKAVKKKGYYKKKVGDKRSCKEERVLE